MCQIWAATFIKRDGLKCESIFFLFCAIYDTGCGKGLTWFRSVYSSSSARFSVINHIYKYMDYSSRTASNINYIIVINHNLLPSNLNYYGFFY